MKGGQTALLARRGRTVKQCSLDARSEGQFRPPLEVKGCEEGDAASGRTHSGGIILLGRGWNTVGGDNMANIKIIAYLKPVCGWSNGVRAVLQKYNLPYEDRDIINNPMNFNEMVQKSGQRLSPSVEIDGKMLADVSGDEVEAYLISSGLVQKSNASAAAPTDRACETH